MKRRLPVVVIILCGLVIVSTCLAAWAQYPRFYVCMTNSTNETIRYKVEWCTRAGDNCTGYRMWSIAPGETLRHWGPNGNGRMDVNLHTGGSGGIYMDYTFNGTTDGCNSSSSHTIQYNSRGYLRIY